MGLIKRIRELFSSKRYILQAMEEQDRRLERYRGLSTEGLLLLSDQELLEAALSRCDDRICQALGKLSEIEHPDDALALEAAPRTVYILSLMQDILSTDGLLGFLSGEGRAFASMAVDCLLEVGATEHCALYTAFLQERFGAMTRPGRFVDESGKVFIHHPSKLF